MKPVDVASPLLLPLLLLSLLVLAHLNGQVKGPEGREEAVSYGINGTVPSYGWGRVWVGFGRVVYNGREKAPLTQNFPRAAVACTCRTYLPPPALPPMPPASTARLAAGFSRGRLETSR